MKSYRLSGAIIASELVLDDYAVQAEGDVTLTVMVSAPSDEPPLGGQVVHRFELEGAAFLTVARGPSNYRVRLHGQADYDIDDTRVTCRPRPGCPAELLAQLFVDRILPVVMSRRVPVLHASVVAVDGRAAAFLGDSGRGKSTLASALSPPADWMCDDSAVLHLGEHVEVHASYPFARLYPDTLAGLQASGAGQAPAQAHKWRLRRGLTTGPHRLAALFALGPHEAGVRIQRLSARDAIAELARHMHRLDPTDRVALASELEALDRIVAAAPLFRIAYPRRFEELGQIRDAVLARLSSA